MERSRFERLVRQALEGIPEALAAYLDNVDIVVEDWPSMEHLAGHVIRHSSNGFAVGSTLNLQRTLPARATRDFTGSYATLTRKGRGLFDN